MTELRHVEPYVSDPPRPPGPSRVLIWLAALALFGAGIGIGWLVGTEPATETAGTAAVVTAETAPSGSIPETAPPTTAPLVEGGSSAEPVADVAEALLPSIVQIQTSGGIGSGVIYDSNGLILTAAHVVDGSRNVTVRLFDGDKLPGEVLGTDANDDIAVVRVDRKGLPAAPLALDEKPRVGQLAIALGSPWGLDSTVTAGVVSAVDRPLSDARGITRSMIQTDAPINPGNSGGALADRYGRVIGINVSIFSVTGANSGVGFAVPIDRAYEVAQAIVEGKRIEPAFLGVRGTDRAIGEGGALITEVMPGSAAEQAGIQVGDLVTSLDGEPITGIRDLAAAVRSRQPGDVVELEVVRDGETLTLQVELGAQPSS